MIGLAIFILMIFSLLVISAAISDLLHFKIPNFISIFLAFLFFFTAFMFRWNFQLVLENFLTSVAMLIVCFILFNRGFIGGGDAKLISAISIWSGLDYLYEFIIITAFTGGFLALIFLLLKNTMIASKLEHVEFFKQFLTAENHIPYGLAIAIGALSTFYNFTIFQYIINTHMPSFI